MSVGAKRRGASISYTTALFTFGLMVTLPPRWCQLTQFDELPYSSFSARLLQRVRQVKDVEQVQGAVVAFASAIRMSSSKWTAKYLASATFPLHHKQTSSELLGMHWRRRCLRVVEMCATMWSKGDASFSHFSFISFSALAKDECSALCLTSGQHHLSLSAITCPVS